MKLKTKTAHDYVNDEKNIFATSPLYSDVRIVKDKPVMLVKNTTQGWELHYTSSSFGRAQVYNIESFMIKDGRMYMFHFFCEPLKVPPFLPIVQKMIDSFQAAPQ